MTKFLKRFYLALILIFLYVPIVVLIVQSFNAGKSRALWEGFSFRWYGELFRNSSIMSALWVTVSIAVLATVISTVLGTLAAIGIYAMKKRPQNFMMTLTNLPNTMPDIVTGISLMLLFIFAKVDRGYWTMLLAHVTFDVPYVVLAPLDDEDSVMIFQQEEDGSLTPVDDDDVNETVFDYFRAAYNDYEFCEAE